MGLFKRRIIKPKVITRIKVEDHGEPKMIFRYKLSLEDFREYNMAVSAGNIESDRKKKRIWGMVALLLSAVFWVMTWMYWADTYARQTYIVAGVLLLILGAYTLMFHRFFFAKQLERSSVKYYNTSIYLQNFITEAFYEEGMLEKAAPRDAYFTWDKFQRAWNSENLFYLEFNLANQLILPIRVITEAGYTLDEMLEYCNSRIEAAKAKAEQEEASAPELEESPAPELEEPKE